MIFIVGGKGLTGSACVRFLQKNKLEYEIIQKENKGYFFGKSCDVLIFANGNAKKYRANQEPFLDFYESISSVVEYVHKIKYKKFIFLSTVDVYDQKESEKTTNEDISINEEKLDTYGFHKLFAEKYVKKYCNNFLILRLGGLVGKGLQKNPVFYYIKTDSKVTISPKSEMNFIHTDFVAEIIFNLIKLEKSNEVFNIASKNSIKIEDIKKIIDCESKFSDDSDLNVQKYKINIEKIQKIIDLPTSEKSIKKYFDELIN